MDALSLDAPIIKASPFSTGNVPNRYVGIKKNFPPIVKSVARTLPHYLFRQFLASFIFECYGKEGVPVWMR